MSPSFNAFLDDAIPRVFADRPGEVHPWFFDYFGELAGSAARRRYARALGLDLRLAGVDLVDRVAVDAGAGFGLALHGLACAGVRQAVGIEPYPVMARTARYFHARYGRKLPAAVVRGSVHALPLPPASVDFIYSNEALSHYLKPDLFFVEAARVLKPKGRLMICDGNNAANRRTVRHVRDIWRRFELGPAAENLHGHRIEVPYSERRRLMIAAAIPGLDDERLTRLAWGTFGLHGGAIVERARQLLDGGRLPEAAPEVDRAPVDPDKGDFIENLVDPRAVREALEALGFTVRVHAHFGGARGAFYEVVNRALRAATPLTLAYARSVKIVAVRR